MDFWSAVKNCFTRYFGFSGRACRSEFWYFGLFCELVMLLALIIGGTISMAEHSQLPLLLIVLVMLPLLIPGISIAVRRLHDTNHSGWWLLLGFVPLLNFFLPMIWYFRPGTPAHNRFGADPIAGAPRYPLTFWASVRASFAKYACFRGRASRDEFFYFVIFQLYIASAANMFSSIMRALHLGVIGPAFFLLVMLAFLLPGLGVAIRRLHDIGRTGWWWWLSFLPIIGTITLFIWHLQPGDAHPNAYGDDPMTA